MIVTTQPLPADPSTPAEETRQSCGGLEIPSVPAVYALAFGGATPGHKCRQWKIRQLQRPRSSPSKLMIVTTRRADRGIKAGNDHRKARAFDDGERGGARD